jgi:hypothetical protein
MFEGGTFEGEGIGVEHIHLKWPQGAIPLSLIKLSGNFNCSEVGFIH